MSKITNSNFVPGQTLSHTELNAKFTGVATATAAVNGANARASSVDVAQVNPSSMFVEYSGGTRSTGDVAVNQKLVADRTVQATILETTFTQFTVPANSILRIYYQMTIKDTAYTLNDGNMMTLTRDGGLCFVSWLEYKNASNAWVPVPGLTALGALTGAGQFGAAGYGFDFGARTSPEGLSIATIPIGHWVQSSNGGKGNYETFWGDGSSEYKRYSFMRSYYKAYDSSGITMKGLRVQMLGAFRGYSYTDNSKNQGMLVMMDSTAAGKSESLLNASDLITLTVQKNAQLGYIVLRSV